MTNRSSLRRSKATLAVAGVAGSGLSLRYVRGRRRAEADWHGSTPASLYGLGAVSELRILPLVDAQARDGLLAEHGVSYLVTADGLRILFDVGLSGGPQATLATNAQALGVDLAAIDVVVISHTHLDHTGGPVAALRRRVKIPDPTGEVEDVNTLMPVSTRHRQARAVPAANARVLAAGVATTGTIPRMLFFLGWTPEQALMVNVRDRGVVVIVGCGHQGVERLLARVEALVQAPIYAVVGGLHLPVHGLPAQDLIGTARWPWQQTTERDVTEAIEALSRRKPHLVALSPHDSSPWTLDRFATAFAASYRTIRVGDEIHISAHASSPAPNQPPEHRSHHVNGQLQTEMTTTLGAVR